MVDTVAAVSGDPSRPPRAALTAFTLGAMTGGAVSSTALGALPLTAMGQSSAIAGLMLLSMLGAAIEAGWLRVPAFPRRQVPAGWRLRFGGTRALLLFGLVLGAGLFTFITHATFLIVIAIAALAGPSAVLVGIAYGASKAGAVALAWASRPYGQRGELLRFGSIIRRLNVGYLVVLGVSLAAWLSGATRG
jgi:hypothetical protein